MKREGLSAWCGSCVQECISFCLDMGEPVGDPQRCQETCERGNSCPTKTKLGWRMAECAWHAPCWPLGSWSRTHHPVVGRKQVDSVCSAPPAGPLLFGVGEGGKWLLPGSPDAGTTVQDWHRAGAALKGSIFLLLFPPQGTTTISFHFYFFISFIYYLLARDRQKWT